MSAVQRPLAEPQSCLPVPVKNEGEWQFDINETGHVVCEIQCHRCNHEVGRLNRRNGKKLIVECDNCFAYQGDV